MRDLTRYILIIVFLFISASAQSQDVDSTAKKDDFKVKKAIKQATKKIKYGNVYAASDLLEEVMVRTPDDAASAYKLAGSYYTARDYKAAEKWYKVVLDTDPTKFPMVQYMYATMLKYNGKYVPAKKNFEEFAKAYKGDDSRVVRKWAKIDAEGCELAIRNMDTPVEVNVKHLDESVNSHYTDISPLMWDDTTLLYASLPTDTVIVINDRVNPPDYFIKLYSATLKDGEYSNAEIFERFNVMGMHIANGSFSYDKTRFYFTRCDEGKNQKIDCAIYVSKLEEGKWSEPEMLPGIINETKSTSTHPFLAPYKRGEVLYFTSDREGGKGGLDIWYSTITSKGVYRAPRNAGTKVNTDRDEATPYFDRASGTLFFSSNGHAGMGGYDVFSTEGELSRWSAEPKNLGYPLNTSTDEMYYRAKDNNSGFLVSNRPGIISIRSETCCDDIFSYEYFTLERVAVKGYVYDEDDTTKTPLTNAGVSLHLQGFGGLDSDILVDDDVADPSDPYFFELNFDRNYKVTGSAEGYLASSSTFDTKGIQGSDTLHVDIYLKKFEIGKAYRLKNIYYDFDKWNLREASKNTLDTLYDIMMENPTIIVELGSHTDSRGSASYNARLSQKRAESCVNYLIKKGIPQSRLTAKGYGETQHLDDCLQYDECPEDNSADCPCHQLNRRTEFKVIGELDGDLIYEDEVYEDEE